MTAAEKAVHLYKRLVPVMQAAEKENLLRQLLDRYHAIEDCTRHLELQIGGAQAQLLRATIRDLKAIGAQIKQMAEAVQQPFMLFVVGMGKFGKSTLINALIGEAMAEVDVLPKTWKIDVYSSHMNTHHVVIKYVTGESKQMSVQQARALLEQEERLFEESRRKVHAELQKMLPNTKSVTEREEMRDYLKKQYLYQSPISEVHWPTPASPLLEDFALIDTPGLFQELLPDELRSNIRDYYHKADGVLWMLDATKIASQKPYEILESLDAALAEVGGRTDNIIGVLNRIDLIPNEDDRKRVLEQAHKLFAQKFRDIVPISAKQAWDAAKNKDDSLRALSGIDGLIDAIHVHFTSRAVQLRRDSKLLGLQGYLQDACKIATSYSQRLSQDEQRREQNKAEFEKDMEEFKQEMQKHFNETVGNYRSSVSWRISSLSSDTIRQWSEMPSESCNKLLRDEFFEVPRLQQLASQVLNLVPARAQYLLEKHYRRSIFSEYTHFQPPQAYTGSRQLPSAIYQNVDTSFINNMFGSGFADSLALTFGGWVKVAVIALFHKGRIQNSLSSQLYKLVDPVVKQYEASVEQSSENITRTITEVRENTFRDLHPPRDNVQEVLNLLAAIIELSQKPVRKLRITDVLKNGKEAAHASAVAPRD